MKTVIHKKNTDFFKIDNHSETLVVYSLGLISVIHDKNYWTSEFKYFAENNSSFSSIMWSPKILSLMRNNNNFNVKRITKPYTKIYLKSVNNLIKEINKFKEVKKIILIGYSYGTIMNLYISNLLSITKIINISFVSSQRNFFEGFYGNELLRRGLTANEMNKLKNKEKKYINKSKNYKYKSDELKFYQPEYDINIKDFFGNESDYELRILLGLQHHLRSENKEKKSPTQNRDNWRNLFNTIYKEDIKE